eukprot:3940628-Rhodomonas_salina.2
MRLISPARARYRSTRALRDVRYYAMSGTEIPGSGTRMWRILRGPAPFMVVMLPFMAVSVICKAKMLVFKAANDFIPRGKCWNVRRQKLTYRRANADIYGKI